MVVNVLICSLIKVLNMVFFKCYFTNIFTFSTTDLDDSWGCQEYEKANFLYISNTETK